ncbi:MAG: AcrR family transcriptional regulator [Verrucomicrobiales bacterium]|jgi:AcrR family transcriptional regulator
MASESTKEQLLRSALEAFAAKGYGDATVSEICESAHANIAAVNYHFGNKESLFQAALQRAFEIADDAYPIRAVAADTTPEDRLLTFMTAMILRCFDQGPAGQFDRIMSHDATRDDAPKWIIMEQIKTHGDYLDGTLSALLNTRSAMVLSQAHADVIALCVFPSVVRGVGMMLFPEPPSPSALRNYIDRQVAFAIAGLSALSKLKK